MKFLLDENVDYRLASFLTHLGHEAKAISYDYPYGLKDREVLRIAHGEKRILITNDRDFGELIFSHHLPHSGVILFRLKRGDIHINARKDKLQQVLNEYVDHLQHFIVITPKNIRVRKSREQVAA